MIAPHSIIHNVTYNNSGNFQANIVTFISRLSHHDSLQTPPPPPPPPPPPCAQRSLLLLERAATYILISHNLSAQPFQTPDVSPPIPRTRLPRPNPWATPSPLSLPPAKRRRLALSANARRCTLQTRWWSGDAVGGGGVLCWRRRRMNRLSVLLQHVCHPRARQHYRSRGYDRSRQHHCRWDVTRHTSHVTRHTSLTPFTSQPSCAAT